MPYARGYRRVRKSGARRPRASRKPYQRAPQRSGYKRALARSTLFAARRLGQGLQFHKSGYNEAVTMTVGGTANWYNQNFMRDIPKYRNDPTATARQANFQQCRLRDKLYVKGAKFRIGVANIDPNQNVMLRCLFFRNTSWDENVDTGASNWFESPSDGSYTLPSSSTSTALIQHFNQDLLRNKKKDMFFDRKIMLAATSGYTGRSVRSLEFYVPINQMVNFESKGDSASADDITNGRYWYLMCLSSNDGAATGDCKINYTFDFIWAEN